MALNKFQQSQIKSLLTDDRWRALMVFLEEKINGWNAEKVAGTNEFEVLRSVFTKEGKVEGLKEFYDGLERCGFE